LVRERTRELKTLWRELDPAALSPRIAALVYLAAGLLVGAVAFVAPGGHDAALVAIATASACFGAVALVLPWHRWPRRAQLVFALVAFMLFACGGALARSDAGPYLAALPLPFVYLGFTQSPGTSSLMAPVAALSLIVAARFSFDQTLVGALVFALPMSVLVGEMIAQAELHRRRAERRVEHLLRAVRVLARVEDERIGAQLVASLSAELLGAQAVTVLLADRDGGRRYLNRAFFGHPSLAETAPLLMDLFDCEGTRSLDATRFVSLDRTRSPLRAAAIVPLPGVDTAPIGLVVAMWGTPRTRLRAPARQAAELLSEEAGRMFRRLRTTAALAHDAETDPLTDLANRRTFTRALDTLQPGDALVIVDLDHFKEVNDRHGHQAGDATLRALARCLRDNARQVDCVARYGGEEFAVVLPGSDARGAIAMLTRMRTAWTALGPRTTFSSGIAVHEAGMSPKMTLRRADAALYEAKALGRDRDVVAGHADVVLR
jgi:diguanylate cyclase (GGDEF)-like protein